MRRSERQSNETERFIDQNIKLKDGCLFSLNSYLDIHGLIIFVNFTKLLINDSYPTEEYSSSIMRSNSQNFTS